MIYTRCCNVVKLGKAVLLGSPYSFKVYSCIRSPIAVRSRPHGTQLGEILGAFHLFADRKVTVIKSCPRRQGLASPALSHGGTVAEVRGSDSSRALGTDTAHGHSVTGTGLSCGCPNPGKFKARLDWAWSHLL